MSKFINSVVDTHSKEEREELIEYVSRDEKFISIIDDSDGFQLIGVREDGEHGYLGVLNAQDLLENHFYKHFPSVKEFITYHEGLKNRKKIVARVTMTFPDGNHIHLPIYEGETMKDRVTVIAEQWYKDTNSNPQKYDHFIIKDKCPKCGGEMHACIKGEQCFVWCINSDCGHHGIEEGDKVRERIYERHGLKTKWVKKEGAAIVMTNKNKQKH